MMESPRAQPPTPEYVPLRRIRWDGAGGGRTMLFGHETWLAILGLSMIQSFSVSGYAPMALALLIVLPGLGRRSRPLR